MSGARLAAWGGQDGTARHRSLGHESGSRRAVSCVCPFSSSSSSSSEERAPWVPLMGEQQRGAVVLPTPRALGSSVRFVLRFLHATRCHRGVPRARELRRL